MPSELDKELSSIRHIIYLCSGQDCKKAGAKPVGKGMEQFLKQNKLVDKVLLVRTKCTGQCDHAPIACIQPEQAWYGQIQESDLPAILSEHLLKNGHSEKETLSIPVAQPQLTRKRKS